MNKTPSQLTLLHERAYSEPEAVEDGELILYLIGVWVARVGITPFVRTEPRDDKQHKANTQVGGDHVHPHLQQVQWRHLTQRLSLYLIFELSSKKSMLYAVEAEIYIIIL